MGKDTSFDALIRLAKPSEKKAEHNKKLQYAVINEGGTYLLHRISHHIVEGDWVTLFTECCSNNIKAHATKVTFYETRPINSVHDDRCLGIGTAILEQIID